MARAHWGSRIGFVLAAAGSAVGLGNIWKFPYVTGTNGGGLFVLVYLACIALIGLPIMIGEILLGRAAQSSPVGAFRKLAGRQSPWVGLGWMGVAAAFIILSYYSVVAGWTMHYAVLAITGRFAGLGPERVGAVFGEVYASAPINLGWHLAFMALTMAVVVGGVQKGIERWARILMPALFLMLLALLLRGVFLPGFGEAMGFVFGLHADRLTASGVLEAMGQAFFSLSLGMGAMLTYGSYMGRDADIVQSSISVSFLDTMVALLAAVVVFPITFSFGMEPAGGPGLVFKNIPIAFAQLPAGGLLGSLFFLLLVFAALTSSVSLLEVAAAYFIDERGWSRRKAVLVTGTAILLLGVPSALSGGTTLFGSGFEAVFGRNWFDLFDWIASNLLLPAGGMGIAVFTAWRLDEAMRREEFLTGSRWGAAYLGWLWLLRFVVPVAVLAVFLHALGLV